MNEPVKCPDCGLWWRTDTHRCEKKKVEEKAVEPFIKSSPYVKGLPYNNHNARAYCLSCYKSGTVYFEHHCPGFTKGYGTPHDTKTWVGVYKDYKITQKEKEKGNDPKKGTLYENKADSTCQCRKKHK